MVCLSNNLQIIYRNSNKTDIKLSSATTFLRLLIRLATGTHYTYAQRCRLHALQAISWCIVSTNMRLQLPMRDAARSTIRSVDLLEFEKVNEPRNASAFPTHRYKIFKDQSLDERPTLRNNSNRHFTWSVCREELALLASTSKHEVELVDEPKFSLKKKYLKAKPSFLNV